MMETPYKRRGQRGHIRRKDTSILTPLGGIQHIKLNIDNRKISNLKVVVQQNQLKS